MRRVQEGSLETRPSALSAVVENAGAFARTVLGPSLRSSKWRQCTWPGCPACQAPSSLCCCVRAAFWVPFWPAWLLGQVPSMLRCWGAVYLDIESGLCHCKGCGVTEALGESLFVCSWCGARFQGGEAWEGMHADISGADIPWMRAIKATFRQQITGCDWDGLTRLVETGSAPPCGCSAVLYRLDRKTDICANCLLRWPVDLAVGGHRPRTLVRG
jgi:hypothetical protein